MAWRVLLSALLLAAAAVEGFSQEQMKGEMLKQLGLSELPKLHKRDLENLVVPAHIKSKYVNLLKLHHSSRRKKRSLPSLAGILRGIPGNADISGEFVYSDTTRQRVVFEMDTRIPQNSEVTMAELRLYKKAPQRRLMTARRTQRPVSSARVSIYWVELRQSGNRSSLVDSRLIPIHETGWMSFDVTQAVHYWSKSQQEGPLHLEVWIEGERPGSYASEMAKSVRFTGQDPSDNTLGKPELVLYTLNLEEYGSHGDCGGSRSEGRCCREEYFINFRALSWTQYWIIEPAGYQAFRCGGGCRQPERRFGYGERRCAVAESAPLPMMYLVKKGDYTEIEVAEFPNMIVEKCGCSMDNISVV
ncbi:lefty1 [Hoplias malabaricus]|uniref:lefty1 n=1 Tax=Hoplias malabaricus TaxID=27720 RepID=UPI003462423B